MLMAAGLTSKRASARSASGAKHIQDPAHSSEMAQNKASVWKRCGELTYAVSPCAPIAWPFLRRER